MSLYVCGIGHAPVEMYDALFEDETDVDLRHVPPVITVSGRRVTVEHVSGGQVIYTPAERGYAGVLYSIIGLLSIGLLAMAL